MTRCASVSPYCRTLRVAGFRLLATTFLFSLNHVHVITCQLCLEDAIGTCQPIDQQEGREVGDWADDPKPPTTCPPCAAIPPNPPSSKDYAPYLACG
ncbi:hypothetical protein EmuJ_000359100 [Echinococcus multilocularis]|uniref:Uncharacterized protein n=1 Tax=Echinococcus multilocularis TaxID=6211 RepID=A0A068Y317_ECHMU|nr:hypothetical protein EmuJ_000359100 [Echinococcus multilocularis]